MHPEPPRLVRRGGDHAAHPQAAHHHRLPTQAGLRRLLRRRVEGIHVEMQDGGRGSHTDRCCLTPLTTAQPGTRSAPSDPVVQPARLRRRASSSAGLWPTRVSPVSTRSPWSWDSAASTSRQTTPTAMPKTPWPPWSRLTTSAGEEHSYTVAPSLISVIRSRSWK